MLKILGSPRRLCDGWTRREMLTVGGLSLLGLGLEDFLRLGEAQAGTTERQGEAGFGRAKSCILLFLFGAPSQIELCDMKPDAPVEYRGELKPIRSSLPGCDVCEGLPNMARVMDRVTVVRSMSHAYPVHSVPYALAGAPRLDQSTDDNIHDPRHWPFIGSVVDYMLRKHGGAVPNNIALPFPLSSRRGGAPPVAGPYPAFLGESYRPLWTEFRGEASSSVFRSHGPFRQHVQDPFVGIKPGGRFDLAAGTDLPADITLDRLDRRRTLLQQFEKARRDLDRTETSRGLDRHRALALDLLRSNKLRDALDLSKEPPRVREMYGMTLFGQATLAARRLVEAGSRFVSVFWDEYGYFGTSWDTHSLHFSRMRNELLPGLDRAFSGLIRDLEARGMLDETLVLCLSEHGRTPRLNGAEGGGRDHWSKCYTNLFAGGGIARGRVVGKSDRIAAEVVDRPVSPKDVLATTYHLLGIAPEVTLHDRAGRPLPLVAEGEVVRELIA